MYPYTSGAFNEVIMKKGRTFKARLRNGNDIIDSGFKSIKISGGSNGADTITIGSTVSQRIEVKMSEQDIGIADKEWLLEMGLLIEDTFEYIPVGYFTPAKPLTDNGVTTFTAYDRMMKLSGIYYCTFEEDEINTISVLNDISEKTGVPIDTTGLSPMPMSAPDGYTCREILMYISQMYGKFANVNRDGVIELHWWTDVEDYEITADNTNGFQHDENEYVLGYLSVASKDEEGDTISLLAGDGQQGISIQNPFMTADVINYAFNRIGGFTYTVSSVSCPIADIRLDPWDIIRVSDVKGNSYRVPLMTLEFEYDGGTSANFSCVGNSKTEEENNYKGPMQMLQEKMEAKVEGLKGAVSIIQQTAGQVSVKNTDEKGTLTTIIDTNSWEAKYVDASGNELSGIEFDFKKAQFIFNGSGHYTGSINVADKFIVDANGNARIYGGKYYAMDEEGNISGFTSMDKDGFTVYSKDAIPAIKIGFPDGNTAYPYVRLNSGEKSDEQSGIIKKFANGMWLGNDAPADATGEFVATKGYNGIFVSFEDGKTYVVSGTDMQNVYTGESIARFG